MAEIINYPKNLKEVEKLESSLPEIVAAMEDYQKNNNQLTLK